MFKVGDRVVRLESDTSHNVLRKGNTYTVKESGAYSSGGTYIALKEFPDFRYVFDGWKFELEDIYNSALAKAMREEEEYV